MTFTRFQRTLLIGTVACVMTCAKISATSLNSISDNSSQTITNYVNYTTTGIKTNTSITFSPATTTAIANYSASHAVTFASPTFNDGMTLRLNAAAANALTLSGTIAFTNTKGTPYITSDLASAALTLSAEPTFTGSGWIEINENTTLTVGAAMTINSPIKIASGKILTLSGDHAITFAQLVSGDGNLAYAGTGTLIFATSPTFNQYAPSGASTLRLNDGITFNPKIALGVGTSSIDVASGGTGTFAGVISGAYALAKGSLSSAAILSGANTFTGGLTIGGGTVKAGNAAAFGTGTLVVTSGTVGVSASGLTIANAVTPTSCTFDIASGLTATFSGALGAGAASKTGAGTLILSNGGNGPTSWNFNGGAVQLSGSGILGAPTTVNSATTLGFLSNVTAANNFILNADLTLNAPAGITGTLDTGVISGTGKIISTGKGVKALSGVNTYNGGTTITEGQITMGANTALGAGSVSMAIGAKLVTNAAARNIAATSAGTIKVY